MCPDHSENVGGQDAPPGDAPRLAHEDRVLIATFGLTVAQRREVAQAFADAPLGLIECAREAHDYGRARGGNGTGLLIHWIRTGEHFERELRAARRTGWRYVRGTHGENWIKDPAGKDTPPPWMELH